MSTLTNIAVSIAGTLYPGGAQAPCAGTPSTAARFSCAPAVNDRSLPAIQAAEVT